MIEAILNEGKKTGFSSIEVFREKIEKKEYEKFVDYSAQHSVKTDFITVRAFWEYGDPVGFSLSSSDGFSIKSAFHNLYSINVSPRRKNFARFLPSTVDKVNINIFDNSIEFMNNQGFEELAEKINELPVLFPGLSLKRIYFAQALKKVYLANTNQLNAKYKKTNFRLVLNVALKNNIIEVNENTVFLQNINPFRMITRSFNLLNSLTDNTKLDKKIGYLVLSPEVATFILKEFSDLFKLVNFKGIKKVHFSPALSIIDDLFLDEQSGSAPFDDEGTQMGEKRIIEKGIFSQSISDISMAFQHNTTSSGNGFRSEKVVFPMVRFSNLYIKPSVLPLKNLLADAGKGILVSLVKLKNSEKDKVVFSAYGYAFENGEIKEPVHFYFKTSFLSFFLHLLKVSREIKFFHSNFNVGSPYILVETKHKADNLFEI